MSILGFDAVGRQAIGQLPTLQANVLTASTGSYSLLGRSVVYQTVQPSGSAGFVTTGAGIALKIFLTGVAQTYAVNANAAVSRIVLSGSLGNYALTGFAQKFAVRLPSAASSYAVTGNAPVLGVSLASGSGAYLVSGYPSTYTRDFEAWFPRPFDGDAWVNAAVMDEAWRLSPHGAEDWATAEPSPDPWMQSGKQGETWTIE